MLVLVLHARAQNHMKSLEFGGGLFLGAAVSQIESCRWIISEPAMDRDGGGCWLVNFHGRSLGPDKGSGGGGTL